MVLLLIALLSGLFIPEDLSLIDGEAGLFKSGRWYMLGVQTLAIVIIIIWTAISSYAILKVRENNVILRYPEGKGEKYHPMLS